MLRNIQPDVYQRKARSQLEDIKHNLKLLDRITQELDSLGSNIYTPEREVSLEKSEKLKVDIRQKLRSMGLNINEMIQVLDFKVNILCKQLSNFLKKGDKNSSLSKVEKKMSTKAEEEYKYQINQLEERIFELQKKQNQYVKQNSELKEKNAKLRQQFTNLSFDSNQRIKQLSERLHNNTSPNLTIKRGNPNLNPETSYFVNSEENQRKKGKNNFVKIKGANNFEQELSPLEMSPADAKKNKNMLDSLTSQSSQYDIKGLGYQLPEYQQGSGNLKFGCFVGKQPSEKTKTGSSTENKKMNFEDKCDKSRRFEFLLNNLVDKKSTEGEIPSGQGLAANHQQNTGNVYTGSNKFPSNYKGTSSYQYKPLNRVQNTQEYKSVFNENLVKRYQI